MNKLSKHACAALLFLMGQGAAGCLAEPSGLEETSGGSDASEDSSGTENVASTAQAITVSQRIGVGKIYDTGASMGFAEFFASLINWSAPAPSMDVDLGNLNTAINKAIDTRTGTYQAISSGAYTPPLPHTLSKNSHPMQPYSMVNGWASGIRSAVANNSSYAAYYDLARNLAIAEGQASIAPFVPQSWQYAVWALDSAVASAVALQGRLKIDISALVGLRDFVANHHSTDAPLMIRTTRESYALFVYADADAICGDQTCHTGETCSSCPGDCGACTWCGDNQCNGGESCSSCPGDCGACTWCGDNQCNGGESCGSCLWDCGQTYQLCESCPNGSGSNDYTITKKACSAQAALSAAQSSTQCLVNYGACW